jgi:ElaB/YqjD/DUF883 family membrane-anchored ribosome-binding protein
METHFHNIEAAYHGVARERVVADLQRLIRDAEELLRSTARSEGAQEHRARLAAALEQARATCAQLQREGWTALRTAASRMDATVREHPYPALGIAFGLGVLVGVLASRR